MSRPRGIAVVTCIVMLSLIAVVASWAGESMPATPVDDEQLKSWWDDLEKGEPESSHALLNFSARPEQAVPFFKEHLKPLILSEEELKQALADLASDDETVWKPAFEKLEYFDPRLAKDLEALMGDVTDQPARNRLIEILCDYPAASMKHKDVHLRVFPKGDGANFFADNSSWWAEMHVANLDKNGRGTSKKKWTRAVRAIVLLEHLATPDAIAILKEMAKGHADATPTKVAEDALARIAQGK